MARFSGCNVWSGLEEDRERDTEKGACAAICDTAFRGIDVEQNGGLYVAEELLERAGALWEGKGGHPIIVFTGGEPGLQLTDKLVELFLRYKWRVHVETNGSIELPPCWSDDYWITLSPKPPMRVVTQRFDEIKVLYPLFDPLSFEKLLYKLEPHRKFVQPVENRQGVMAVKECLEFVRNHPDWALSLQLHKLLDLP
jgi:organic radical activating enzyme